MTHTRRRWIMAATALVACLMMGWYIVVVVAGAVAMMSVLVTAGIRAKERRPGEGWADWFMRIVGEIWHRPNSTAGLHAVLLSCGHRGWIQSHEPPTPGAAAFCCHKRFGPSDEVEVAEVGVEIYGYFPSLVRLKDGPPAT